MIEKRYDIYVEDPYTEDGFQRLTSTANITAAEVGKWLTTAGGWHFKITPHSEDTTLCSGSTHHTEYTE